MAAVQEALELHPDDAEAWMMLAEFQFKALRRGRLGWESLLESLRAVEELCPEGMPEATYMRAAYHYSQEAYARALGGFQDYLTVDASLTRTARRKDAGAILEDLAFLVDYHRHEDLPPPLPIPHVSQPVDEYLPMLAPDGTMLFYTRIEEFKAKGDVTTTRRERFTVSHLDPAFWSVRRWLRHGAPLQCRGQLRGSVLVGGQQNHGHRSAEPCARQPQQHRPLSSHI